MNVSQCGWTIARFSSSIIGASVTAAIISQLKTDWTIPGAFVGCVIGRFLTLPFCGLLAISFGIVGSLIVGPHTIQSSSDKTLTRCGTIALFVAALVSCFPLYKTLSMHWFLLAIGVTIVLSFVPYSPRGVTAVLPYSPQSEEIGRRGQNEQQGGDANRPRT